ncbi:unnamed protein product [Symbiodinium sp. CCMP2456]|nr:unnamed protein product [Symbiodinium sp. CCMP2456]
MGLTYVQKQKLLDSKPPKAKAKVGVHGGSAGSSLLSSACSPAPLPTSKAPPPPPRQRELSPSQMPMKFRMHGQRRMPPRQWHGGNRSAAPSVASSDEMSVNSEARWTRKTHGRGQVRDEAANPNSGYMNAEEIAIAQDFYLGDGQDDDPNYWEERMARDDWDEDRGCFALKSGQRKRLAGAAKALFDGTSQYRTDLVEIFGGEAAITQEALRTGLRALQPIDEVYGQKLNGSQDFQNLEELLRLRRPYLVIWEPRCTLWSNLQYLNRSPEDLDRLRQRERKSVASMCKVIQSLYQSGIHFLRENPLHTPFWETPELRRLRGLPGVQLGEGCMCAFNLRDAQGHLLKKPTGWLGSVPEVLAQLCVSCPGNHEHGQCLGSNNTRKAQVYTRELAKACVNGLVQALQREGDERWCQSWTSEASLPDDPVPWINDMHYDLADAEFDNVWEPPGELRCRVYFLDVSRHHESWQPLLEEAERRLKSMTTSSVTIKPSPFYEQVKALVPWKLKKLQIFRAPKQRRLPQDVLLEGVQHRGAALLFNDGTVSIEAEAVASILESPSSRYPKPVRVAVYFYGDAPSTSLNPEQNLQPEAPRPQNDVAQPDAEDQMKPHQPGYRDISFPGANIPDWVQQVLRRVHTNLGHPPREVLVRQLATAGASDIALKGARALRCETCLRVSPPHQPRVSKAFQARRFNDRLCADVIYVKDIRGGTHVFLNLVDDATCYQVAPRLQSRSEDCVIATLVGGWFQYFGPPDEMAIDAEGAFRGMRFENLHAQLNVAVRCVPPDSHWQLGKAERHGQALKYNVRRLIHQFAALTVPEVNLCVIMACYAKNRLVRRSGSSPAQWVYGRDQKLPAALLSDGGSIEAAQLVNDSTRLMQIEAVRTEAMRNHHTYEAHEALRAALLRKSRPYRGAFYPGQKVAYYRMRTATGDGEGTAEGYRQGVVLALDRNPSSNVAVNIWLRNDRGRLVQCSPEQCRPVCGEQEWWAPDPSDLEVLKNCDEELRIHPRAFRTPSARPAPQVDRGVLRDLEHEHAAARPHAEADLPAENEDDARTVLDPAGNPISAEAPMFSPMMVAPPTPRSTPGTPRTRARSRSAVRDKPGLPEQDRRPSDLALPGSLELPEPPVSGSDRTFIPGQDPPSERALPGSFGNSRRLSTASSTRPFSRQTSQQVGPLERIAESQVPDARGVKRAPNVGIEELGGAFPRKDKPAAASSSSMAVRFSLCELEPTAHLVFCQDCGEQYRIFPKQCPRCGGSHPVNNPREVVSWLDEVKEREAFDALVGVPFERRKTQPLEYGPELRDELDYYQTPGTSATLTSSTTFSSTGMHRLDVLRRHARGQHLRQGWDGVPSETPPIYQYDAFLTACHHVIPELMVEDTSSRKQRMELQALTTSATTTTKTALSEQLARLLLRRKDYSHDSCQQLLEVVDMKPPDRRCLAYRRPHSGSLTLGYYSHGNHMGVTRATHAHGHLTKYLNKYLQSHGARGPISSLFIARNTTSSLHRDVHNSKGSLNWHVTFGDHVVGDLWVELPENEIIAENCEQRSFGGQRHWGFRYDTHRNLTSFEPDRLHGSDKFQGERYVITAYQTRNADIAPVDHLNYLKKLNFTPSSRKVSFLTSTSASSETVDDSKAPSYVPVFQAYPTKAQTSASTETEKVVAMESSSESEGEDGTFEAKRAAQQARKKEVHWKSMSPEEVEPFVEALKKEWSEWERWSSCKAVSVAPGEVAPHLILKSRVCYRWKPVPEGQKAKARIVIAGFRDPHLPLLTRDAPVLARTSLHLLLQWSASFRVLLWNADCRSAFLQGDPDTERPEAIYMRPPQDPVALQAVPQWSDARLLYRLSAPVYGQSNAPRQWFNHVVRVLKKLGWTQHSLDPCLFMQRNGDKVVALLGIHVDDLIGGALAGFEETLNKVESHFTWGSPWCSGEFTFVGRHIKQWPDGSITLDQASYVNEVPATKVKLDDGILLHDRPELVTEFRSGIGSLQWLAGTTRGDIAADTSLLQKSPKDLTVADLKEVNAVLRYVRATADSCEKFAPVDPEKLIFVAYGDSGFANAPGNKSQGGLVITITDQEALTQPRAASLVDWKSYRHQRVLRSTLAAEASALDRAYDHARFMAMVWSEMIKADYVATMNERPLVEVVPVTDARSLWDAIHRLSTSFTEKRVEIDIAALRQQCRGLRWVPTEQMKADCMTKRSRLLRDTFRRWMAEPFVTLVDSKAPGDLVTGADANAAWRAK